MSRFGANGRVFFIEEAVVDGETPSLEVIERGSGIFVCVPHIPANVQPDIYDDIAISLIDELLGRYDLNNYVAWFYTPMMLGWARDLRPLSVIYDCMDQLSAFKNAPPELIEREKELFARADLVFTGGRSLFEAKRDEHPAVYAFPSSIDKDHFAKAMEQQGDVAEQSAIDHPRIGFVGVIDERSDLDLLGAVADILPQMNFIMVGPVVKIDESSMPRRSNIHYLGQKTYDELPAILAGWDVAMMPFALNESTRYISPTKTPEFLAAGLPVVSTPIADVVDPYGNEGLVRIASTPQEFAACIEEALQDDRTLRRAKAEEFLREFSWDTTFKSMQKLILDHVEANAQHTASAGS